MNAAASLSPLQVRILALIWLKPLQESLPIRSPTRIIKSKFPDTRVLVLTMNTDKSFSDRACQAGASGFLGKDCGKERHLGAIRHSSPGK